MESASDLARKWGRNKAPSSKVSFWSQWWLGLRILMLPIGSVVSIVWLAQLPDGPIKTILGLTTLFSFFVLLPIFTYQFAFEVVMRAENCAAGNANGAQQKEIPETIARLDGTTRSRKPTDPK